jgi:hypothetical protein
MRFGSDVEVLAPAELRERIAASARAVLKLYEGDSTAPAAAGRGRGREGAGRRDGS